MTNFKKHALKKILVLAWLAFATIYVVYSEYNRIGVMVAENAYNKGYQDSVAQLMVEADKCEPFPANLGEKTITLMKLECLQKGTEPVETVQVAE